VELVVAGLSKYDNEIIPPSVILPIASVPAPILNPSPLVPPMFRTSVPPLKSRALHSRAKFAARFNPMLKLTNTKILLDALVGVIEAVNPVSVRVVVEISVSVA
jgi:hypothetical protein